jgi:hypothetical protein
MPIVERVYQPTAKDNLSGLRQSRAFAQQTAAGALVTVSLAFAAVPPDTARIITNMSILATPGAAQRVLGAYANIFVPGPQTIFQVGLQSDGAQAVASLISLNWAGEIILLPNETLQLNCEHNAGAASNSCVFSYFGYDVPRANIV